MKKNKPNILEGRTKEWDANEWQGRSPSQYSSSARGSAIALLGMIVIVIMLVLFGCGTVKSTLTPSELEKVTDCCKDK
tara:strand:+ start:586 stop:819 length:234 start_codon:yes stop_codon:yes gene_type:complete